MSKKYSLSLWQKIKIGDIKALSELFESQYTQLYNYGCKLIESDLLVEDAIQDIFISIWKGHQNLADVSSVESYLLISLRRRLLRLIEKERKISQTLQYDEPEIVFIPKEFQFSNNDDKERHEILIQALNKLPARRKEAIYLHFYNGMDYEEISEIMDLGIQTVRNYISYALEQVRVIFNEKELPQLLISVSILLTILPFIH